MKTIRNYNKPLCCCWLIRPLQNDAKDLKNDWNPGTWVLIWEYSARAIQWIPTRQGLDGFLKNVLVLVLWTKVASALKGLKKFYSVIEKDPFQMLHHIVLILYYIILSSYWCFLLSEYFNMKNIHMNINVTKPRLSNWQSCTWTLLRIQVLYWKCISSTTTTCCHCASYYANSSH